MSACAGSQSLLQGGMVTDEGYIYVSPPDSPEMPAHECKYMLLTPQEFAEIAPSSSELNPLMLPLALVVIFVLGWIAGAQR